MDPLEPWIDASAVRRLADRLLSGSSEPVVEDSPDAGFGMEFVGFAAQGSPRVAEKESPPVFEREIVAPPLQVTPDDGAQAPGSGRGPLATRLARFRDSLIRHTGARGVFILDREGKPVMEDPAYARMHFLARSLAQAYRPVAGQAGNVHVKIGAGEVLEVVPVETPFGWLVLGAVVPHPLAAAAVAEIAVSLRQAATPEGA